MLKLIRLTTVPLSLQYLLRGQPRYMSAFFEVLCVSSGPAKDLEEVAKREGVKVQEVEMTRQITPFKDLKSVWKLYKLFKKEKPQIVHTHTPKAGIVGMLAANLAGVPLRLHTVAGLPLMEVQGLKRFVLDTVEKLTYSFATKVYPNSKGLEEFILSHRLTNKSKVKMIGNGSSNGIDTTFFKPSLYTKNSKEELRAQLGISKEDFVFVFVGRLVSDKGINELVNAFNGLTRQPIKRSIHYKLLLVGPLETELDPLQHQTLNEIESNPTIITTGFQPDVRPYFAISNALVFPSFREGFPNVVMQAGAMGLPSIVTDINGCNEIIEDGRNGLIIPPKDTKALQEKMLRLMEDEPLYKHLASNSREMITSRYEQKLVWEALLDEYKSLLKKKKMNHLEHKIRFNK
jgi:glycosyltransferase involved in cell wall biosynthesis